MKFLCDNCKAKYQIDDAKAAGKTIRMKCRKCGHQIEVRSEVTETSVVSTMPTDPDAADRKPVPRAGLATSLATQKPRPSQAFQGPQGAGGALAGAFQKTVRDGTSPSGPPESNGLGLSMTDEWYVAINGVPVGPVRISEIRRKAATLAVTEDSLCWQEGLEEWRPIRSVPELAAIVREAAQGNRPSLIGAPPEAPKSALPRPPQPAPSAPSAPRSGSIPPRAPSRPVVPRTNVVPFQGRVGTATGERASLDDAPRPASPSGFGASAAAFAAPVAAASLTPAPSFAATPAASPFGDALPVTAATTDVVADPFAIAPAPAPVPTDGLVPAAARAPSSPPEERRAKNAGPPIWIWPVVVMSGVFAVAAAYFAFGRPPAPQQVIVQVPVPTPSTTTPPANTAEPEPPPAETAAPTPSATTPSKVAAATPKTTTPAPSNERKTADLSGLLGGKTAGPSTGSGSGSGASGGGLDAASVQRVVRDRQAGVKRTCWDRGGGDQKSSANVTVAVNVAANGNVSSANATGDDPVVAKCIEKQVSGWSFPAPGSPTTVNIPFHFVRQ